MSEMVVFKREFVERTIEILNRHYENEEYEVTLLLNCLLALVSLPIELEKDKKGENTRNFKKDCVNKLNSLVNTKYYARTKYKTIFRNIRNSIAHLNIQPTSFNGKIQNVTLWNIDEDGILNFKINISVNDLKKFAEYVANEYINRFF